MALGFRSRAAEFGVSHFELRLVPGSCVNVEKLKRNADDVNVSGHEPRAAPGIVDADIQRRDKLAVRAVNLQSRARGERLGFAAGTRRMVLRLISGGGSE